MQPRSNVKERSPGQPRGQAKGGASSRSKRAGLVQWAPKEKLDRHGWIATGQRLGRISRCNQWWLGDWVRYGERKWGETYAEAAKITGYDPRSLANMASIARAFEASRRRDDLTWSHHAAVAGLEAGEQDSWLNRAAGERMSVADLRIELRAAQRLREAGELEDVSEGAPLQALAIICPRCGHTIEPER